MACFRSLIAALLMMAACLPLWAAPAEGSFDRTLPVSGGVNLEVKTGSGSISVRNGPAGVVTVHGIIRANDSWIFGGGKSAQDKIKALESNPPIQQNGNAIHIGPIEDDSLRENVSISYQVVTPPDTRLSSQSGSGAQSVEGIKGPVTVRAGSGSLKIMDIDEGVDAHTGSGGIDLDGIAGAVSASAGSGSIHANHIGALMAGGKAGPSSDVQVRTGSGGVRLENVSGKLFAETGSGGIEAAGDPEGRWELRTGSGGIRVKLPPNAAFEISARTGSGSIRVDHPVTAQGEFSKHEVRGTVRGGGFALDLRAGSGSIHVE